MPYRVDMREAARRHFEAAQKLCDVCQRPAVAAYLFGIAAECAVKHLAQSIPELRTHDVQYVHFPVLRHRVLDALRGRRGLPLRRLLEHDSFLNEWQIDVRYAPNKQVLDKPITAWREHATSAVRAMEADG
jgi:hypothetical protein